MTMIVQVNGKVRERAEVAADISDANAESLALAAATASGHLSGVPKNVIVLIPKLVNIVV
ncbi:MAG: hypothetical protein R2706_15730 [Acidimicrobiales bacterium]